MSTEPPMPANPHAVQLVTRDENWVARNVSQLRGIHEGKLRSMIRTREAVSFVVATTTIALMGVFLYRSTDDGLVAKDVPVSKVLGDEWAASKDYAIGAASGAAAGLVGVWIMNQFHPGDARPDTVQSVYNVQVSLNVVDAGVVIRANDTQNDIARRQLLALPARDIGDSFTTYRFKTRVTVDSAAEDNPNAQRVRASIDMLDKALNTASDATKPVFRRHGASLWAYHTDPTKTDGRRYVLTPLDRDVLSVVFNIATKPVFWGSESADALIFDEHQSPVSPKGREILRLLCGPANPALPYKHDDWYRLSRGLQRELCMRSTLWAPQSHKDFLLHAVAGTPEAGTILRYMGNRHPEFYLHHSLDRDAMNEEALYRQTEYAHDRLSNAITAEHGGAFLLLDDDTKRRLADLWGIQEPAAIELRDRPTDATRQLARRRIDYMLQQGGLLASRVTVQCGGECDASSLAAKVDRDAEVSLRVAGVLRDQFQVLVKTSGDDAANAPALSEKDKQHLRLVTSDGDTLLLHHVVRAARMLHQALDRHRPPQTERVAASDLEKQPPRVGELNRIVGRQRVVRVEREAGGDGRKLYEVIEPRVVYAATTADFGDDRSSVTEIRPDLMPDGEAERRLGETSLRPYAYFETKAQANFWFLELADQKALLENVRTAFRQPYQSAPTAGGRGDAPPTDLPPALGAAAALLKRVYNIASDDLSPSAPLESLPDAVKSQDIWPRKGDFVVHKDGSPNKRLVYDGGKAYDYIFVLHKAYEASNNLATYARAFDPPTSGWLVPGGTYPRPGDAPRMDVEYQGTIDNDAPAEVEPSVRFVSRGGTRPTPANFGSGDQVSDTRPSDGVIVALVTKKALPDQAALSSFFTSIGLNGYANETNPPNWYQRVYSSVEVNRSSDTSRGEGWWSRLSKLWNSTTPPKVTGLETEDEIKKAYGNKTCGFIQGVVPGDLKGSINLAVTAPVT
jgi:hypothetical protein